MRADDGTKNLSAPIFVGLIDQLNSFFSHLV